MKKFNGKAIYNPSGKAGEYSYWACNLCVGCSNSCTYCYCKKGILASQMGGDNQTLKKSLINEEKAFDIFKYELVINVGDIRKHGLFFSFSTDPMLDQYLDLHWKCIMFAMRKSVPVKILTKVAGRWVDDIIENMHDSYKGFLAIGFTLTGKDTLEPGASPNAMRIKAMKDLHEAGFKTFASIEPIIDIDASLAMIDECVDCCDLFKVGLLSGNKYAKKDLRDFIFNLSQYPDNRFYLKDSLIKAAGHTRDDLPVYDDRIHSCWVTRDYNMFCNKK